MNIEIWGKNIWFLLHGLIHKLNNEEFKNYKDDFIYIFTNIVFHLPCFECSRDAHSVIDVNKLKKFTNKNDMEKYIFDFHNYVNKKLKKNEFNYDDINKYDKINIEISINNFKLIFSSNSNIPQLMGQSFHRQNILPLILIKIENIKKYLDA
tara:strand:+ start:575 stop:1030 length:456 start_codon:yes stop_codon:yes gene_type:complete